MKHPFRFLFCFLISFINGLSSAYSQDWYVIGNADHCTASTCAYENRKTNLLWSSTLGIFSLDDARKSCAELRTLNRRDWRLPYFEELNTLAFDPPPVTEAILWFGENAPDSWVFNSECRRGRGKAEVHSRYYCNYYSTPNGPTVDDRYPNLHLPRERTAALGVRCVADGWIYNQDLDGGGETVVVAPDTISFDWSMVDTQTNFLWKRRILAKPFARAREACRDVRAELPTRAQWELVEKHAFASHAPTYQYAWTAEGQWVFWDGNGSLRRQSFTDPKPNPAAPERITQGSYWCVKPYLNYCKCENLHKTAEGLFWMDLNSYRAADDALLSTVASFGPYYHDGAAASRACDFSLAEEKYCQ